MAYKSKYRYPKDYLKKIDPEKLTEYLHKNVFSNTDFQSDVDKTAEALSIDRSVVEDVLKIYFSTISRLLNTAHRAQTKINIIGFLRIFIRKGNRI